jgi:hypothetical protein
MLRPMVLALIGACAITCSVRALSFSPEEEAARDAALQWLQLVDSGNYKIAAAQMAEQVRAPERWVTYFIANRAPRGKVKNRDVVQIKHTPTLKGAPVWWKFATVRFKTSFERPPSSGYGAASKSGALEEVVLTKTSCCWDVSGYRILSEPDGRQGKSNEGNEFGDE